MPRFHYKVQYKLPKETFLSFPYIFAWLEPFSTGEMCMDMRMNMEVGDSCMLCCDVRGCLHVYLKHCFGVYTICLVAQKCALR